MRKIIHKANICCMAFALMLSLGGCGNKAATEEQTVVETTEAVADVSDATASDASAVASSSEMVEAESVVTEDMVPITADQIEDGVYSIGVNSSSSMFNITACELTVKDGEMTAVMHMGGTGYLYVYMGTGEEAVAASEADYISFEEESDGTHTFTVPVEALDSAIDCTAFSKKKEKWYDRQLCFKSDAIPVEAFRDGVFNTAASLGLADGEYSIEVSLEGGSGKASVASPAKLSVENGVAMAEIIMSSENYDYMLVKDEKYLPVNETGNSAFLIPVDVFDYAMPIVADTVAMSEPHEIEYTLFFDSATINEYDE
ncbi:MAG: hypothetical protein J5962_03380 [Lachnospiraceae bacterium]|nr:hypothetical protein [Lachnospiraceae bacterium]